MFNIVQLLLAFLIVFGHSPQRAPQYDPVTSLTALGAALVAVMFLCHGIAAAYASAARFRQKALDALEAWQADAPLDERARYDLQTAHEQHAAARARLQRLAGPLRLGMDMIVLAGTFALFQFFDMADVVRYGLGVEEGLDYLPMLAPWLLLQLAAWTAAWRIDRVVRGAAWNVGSYLLFHGRMTLFGIVPILALGVAKWVTGSLLVFQSFFFLDPALIFGVLALLTIFMPIGVRYLLRSEPMAAGPLKDRLTALARRCGVGVGGIYVWRTGKAGLPTAFLIGVLRPFRYVFITDALLKTMSEDEIEAVFAHELGHARHRHLWLLLGFMVTVTLLNLALLAVLMGETPLFVTAEFSHDPGIAGGLLLIAPLLLYFFFGFGYLSRRLERQADFFAAKTVGAPPLASALNRIGHVAGGIHFRSGWRHFSIAQRMRELQVVDSGHPDATFIMHRWERERRTAVLGMGALAVICLVLLWPAVSRDLRTGLGTYAFLRADRLRVEAAHATGDSDDIQTTQQAQAKLDRAKGLYSEAAAHMRAYAEWDGAKVADAFEMLMQAAAAEYFAGGETTAFDRLRTWLSESGADEAVVKKKTAEVNDAEKAAKYAQESRIPYRSAASFGEASSP